MAVVALAAGVVEAGTAGRFRPASSEVVVLHVPARAASDPIALLEQQRAREPQNQANAAELAERYVERARAERQQRYFARAEALLLPWVNRPDAGAATLRVQADILQNRHEFAAAMALLDRAIASSPKDNAARLMRASVNLVQGRPFQARPDCAYLLSAGEAAGTICLAQVLGATGNLDRADSLLKALLRGDRQGMSSPMQGWALGLLADFADRSGKPALAERILGEALTATPTDEGIRSALSDLLLARGAHREALAVLPATSDVPTPSIGLLARRAWAQQLLRDPAFADTRKQMRDLLELAARRGDRPHLREETLIALDLDDDAPRALELAKLNFETQRETIDARLLARAAQACADRASLTVLTQWVRETRYEDAQLGKVGT